MMKLNKSGFFAMILGSLVLASCGTNQNFETATTQPIDSYAKGPDEDRAASEAYKQYVLQNFSSFQPVGKSELGSQGIFDSRCTMLADSDAISYLTVQQNLSTRALQWGFYLTNLGSGKYTWFYANVYVNGTLFDPKSQNYEPHGSLPGYKIPKDATILIQATATGPGPNGTNISTSKRIQCTSW